MRYNAPIRGFSLVELSIVLVILGLLTGGILAGQSLIRASELRSVSTQYSQYTTAVQSFRDRYMALPGDMSNAQKFWGIADADAATCVTTAGTGTQTCNGNGDGRVFVSTGSNEGFRFWQHLANAGLIEGSYDGITHGATSYSATTANSPVGKISNAIWFAWNWTPMSGSSGVFDGNYNNMLVHGGIVTDSYPYSAVFLPEEQWNIDVKMDDGKPAIGSLVVAAAGALSNCTTATGATAVQAATLTAEYLLTSKNKTCAIIFRNQF